MSTAAGVPVIDVTDLRSPRTLQAIDGACRDWGFFALPRFVWVAAASHRSAPL